MQTDVVDITIWRNILWILMCGFMVALMQAGFTCLESGLVRSKNSINVAIKNLIDFCISIAIYTLFGFGIMFGASYSGLIGTSHFLLLDDMSMETFAFFFFQAMFCGTATTIVSGAVAERMRFSGYCFAAIVVAGLIYPIVGHWAWNGTDSGGSTGWLGALGFIDFAGSTVVHSVAGWMAFAAILLIGPRVGRFGPEGKSVEGHSLPISTLGVFLLWFGWFGFNGGSTFELNERVPAIISNTALAGAAGGLTALMVTWRLLGQPVVDRIINGVIAGLVAITASADLMTPVLSLLVGGIGGVICVLGMLLLEKLEIDDAIGAVPAHLFAGIWGTLAVALIAPEGAWGTGLTRWEQFLVQFQGVLIIGCYCFLTGYIILKTINRWIPLRVSADDERIGLNVVEHGASTSILDLIIQMDRQARTGDYSRLVEVEPETEAARIAVFYNEVLHGFNVETSRRHMAIQKLSKLANYDTLTGLGNRRLYFDAVKRSLASSKRTGMGGAVLYFDLDGFKQVNDTLGHEYGDRLLKEASTRMLKCVREADVLGRVGGDEFSLLIENTDRQKVQAVAEKILLSVSDPFKLDDQRVTIGVSIGIALFSSDHDETIASIIQKADHAMYTAKLTGKGAYRFHEDKDEDFSPKL
jgi:Amt family ammonium transporter